MAATTLIMIFQENEKGILTTVEIDKDKWRINRQANIAPVYETNYELRKKSDEHWAKGKEFKHVARIPGSLYALWESMGITKDEGEFKKALERNGYCKITKKTL